ncbi:hypothetical protein ACHAXR_013494 [Thalassiosira sp. AJA248-18]
MIGTKQVARVISGRCKIEFADGEIYEGEIENGKAHGNGKFTFDDGEVYDGDWVEDKRHGHGKVTYANGSVYEGQWKNGKKQGKGIFTFADGGVYEGEWKDGKIHGKGQITFADGNVYDGEWKNHHSHGKGTLTYINRDVYDGEWKDGKRHGPGTMKEANGDVYKQVYNNDILSSSKRLATLMNCPRSQRSRTGETSKVVVLNKEHTECGICFTDFSTNTDTSDEGIKRHLPVLSTCNHCYCLGCVLDQQVALSEEGGGTVPECIPCMKCREIDAFRPSEPKYDRRLIDLLENHIPAIIREEQSE